MISPSEISCILKTYRRILSASLLFILILLSPGAAYAQDEIELPIYIVQPGDTLSTIAARFGVSINDIIDTNEITNPNAIGAGAELRIPGLEGIQGRLTTSVVPLGNNYFELLTSRQLPESQFVKLNRITSPAEIVAGTKLLMPELSETELLKPFFSVKNGQTSLEMALVVGQNPWVLMSENNRQGGWDLLTSEQVFSSVAGVLLPQNLISASISDLEITPLPLTQGRTIVVRLKTDQILSITGSLANRKLNFFETEQGEYAAIQGIYARQELGPAAFDIHITNSDGITDSYAQYILVEAGNFGRQAALVVDPSVIDPAITVPEDQFVRSITQVVTPIQYWSGAFSALTDEPCINAPFGTSRSYNNGAYLYYHTGVDFGVCAQNLNIYAPAAGVVAFTGPLEICGNATYIDHGQGVFSGICHQAETYINIGDQVTPGMLIGKIGNTGRSTGPHLHWEVWAGGVQVNPLEWLGTSFP